MTKAALGPVATEAYEGERQDGTERKQRKSRVMIRRKGEMERGKGACGTYRWTNDDVRNGKGGMGVGAEEKSWGRERRNIVR